ncbi:MAG: threonylcarbamoyl-AMP synthase [Sphingobacteriales bacterium]|nr:MAG: threonylcarbamoyl-AMP synthase [Sphingobacteriales bacterium]
MQTVIGTDIAQAAHWLQQGETVAIPTETVYGLAANALNEKAVLKIYAAKNRPHFNPLIIHIHSAEEIIRYASVVPERCFQLIQQFTPGPITFLLPKKTIIPDLVTAGSNKVAIRIPAHPLTQQLLQAINFPLAAPSANPFGYVSPVTAQHVYKGLNAKIPYILDGGSAGVGLESTIVSFDTNNEVVIERLGGVSVEAIEEAIGKPVILNLSHQKPNTPGQLKSHYATAKPLLLGNIEELIQQHANEKIALLTLNKQPVKPPVAYSFALSEAGDLEEAAANLFTQLRAIDATDATIIVAALVPEMGIGRAINDRLRRAQFINKL